MRLCSSLYGKALSICNLAKLFRSWLSITFSGEVDMQSKRPLCRSVESHVRTSRRQLRTADWLAHYGAGRVFVWPKYFFEAWFHDISCTHDSWIFSNDFMLKATWSI
jgi:hypothetical protein